MNVFLCELESSDFNTDSKVPMISGGTTTLISLLRKQEMLIGQPAVVKAVFEAKLPFSSPRAASMTSSLLDLEK